MSSKHIQEKSKFKKSHQCVFFHGKQKTKTLVDPPPLVIGLTVDVISRFVKSMWPAEVRIRRQLGLGLGELRHYEEPLLAGLPKPRAVFMSAGWCLLVG